MSYSFNPVILNWRRLYSQGKMSADFFGCHNLGGEGGTWGPTPYDAQDRHTRTRARRAEGCLPLPPAPVLPTVRRTPHGLFGSRPPGPSCLPSGPSRCGWNGAEGCGRRRAAILPCTHVEIHCFSLVQPVFHANEVSVSHLSVKTHLEPKPQGTQRDPCRAPANQAASSAAPGLWCGHLCADTGHDEGGSGRAGKRRQRQTRRSGGGAALGPPRRPQPRSSPAPRPRPLESCNLN